MESEIILLRNKFRKDVKFVVMDETWEEILYSTWDDSSIITSDATWEITENATMDFIRRL
jgi:hypothetical protein